MNKEEYKEMVKQITPKEKKWKNASIAFLVGGLMGVLSVLIVELIMIFGLSEKDSTIWMLIIFIFLAVLFTNLGFFDTWVSKVKAGLIVPITGFAHSVAASALDYRKDGFVTGIGANIFKLAGSVLLYGTFAAFSLVLLKVILNG